MNIYLNKNSEAKNEIIFIISLLILNINKLTALLSIIILFLYGKRSIENSLKAIIYSFLISQLNWSIFSSNIGSFRTILNIFLISNILIREKSIRVIKKSIVVFVVIIYSLYIIITSFWVSWLPLLSIFKGIYFTCGFVAIFIGIRLNEKKEWISWINTYFKVVTIINLILIFFPMGYNTNGRALNGMFANPNALGIVMVLASAVFAYCSICKLGRYNCIFIIIASIEISLSNSRTSIITLVLVAIYYIFMLVVKLCNSNRRTVFKYLSLAFFLFSVLMIIGLTYKAQVKDFINEKLLKGQTTENVFYSREGQMKAFENDFNSNKILGVGFGVDNANGREKSFELKLSYPVERGNIVLAVLAETGILGMIVFVLLIIAIIYHSKIMNNKDEFIYKGIFIISAILISFGEMTFFSGNSLGVIQWLFIAIFANKTKSLERI